MSGYYVRFKYPEKSKVHVCNTPGWWNRLWIGAKLGAIWHCIECGQEWIFTTGVYELGDSGESTTANDWEKTNVQSNS